MESIPFWRGFVLHGSNTRSQKLFLFEKMKETVGGVHIHKKYWDRANSCDPFRLIPNEHMFGTLPEH